MKHLTIIFLLMGAYSMANAQSFDLSFNHYAINVSDLQTSVDFYENVMRLEQITNQTQKPNIRWFGIGKDLELHVIESSTENLRLQKGVHLSLTLKDLNGFIEHLKELDIQFENWPGDKQTTNSRPDGVRQIYLQDPDGYWIEINDAKAHNE